MMPRIEVPTLRPNVQKLTSCGWIYTTVSVNISFNAEQLAVGTVGLTTSETAKLIEPTMPTPMDPNTYPVMIQVFHNIHCLNLLRKAIWRDYYPDALDMLPDGTANRTSPKALHVGE
jgi:hypothetical protein